MIAHFAEMHPVLYGLCLIVAFVGWGAIVGGLTRCDETKEDERGG